MTKIFSPCDDSVAEFALDARAEIEAVVAVHGHEASHYTVLGPDPWQVIWNDQRTGFASFLETKTCLFSWRSPVARPEEQGELFGRLVEHARGVKKVLIALEVNDTIRRVSEDAGLTILWTGYESFVDLKTWTINGGKREKIRGTRNQAAKKGLTWREAFPATSADDFDGLRHVEQLWRRERPERATDSFLRTDFTELMDLRRYFVCEGPSGIIASVTCTPVNETGWYLQDLVRAPSAPRGATEGAIVLALDTFRDEGFAFASNGPLPFWRPRGAAPEPHQLGALGRRMVKFFDHQYRFQGINSFRSKVEPDWVEPMYVVRTRRVLTPGVARSLTQLMNSRLR